MDKFGGDEENRTPDPLLARQVLSQLSYTPMLVVGLSGLEPPTSRLSGVRSNRLSYRPMQGFNAVSSSGVLIRRIRLFPTSSSYSFLE